MPQASQMPIQGPVRLIMSNNSVRNTTFTSDQLGLRYDIAKHKRVVTVQRWDSRTNQTVVVGEFKLPDFSKDLIRFGPTGPWIPLKDFLNKGHGIFSK
jgi:hypothetical protein